VFTTLDELVGDLPQNEPCSKSLTRQELSKRFDIYYKVRTQKIQKALTELQEIKAMTIKLCESVNFHQDTAVDYDSVQPDRYNICQLLHR
jgi:hypothetical protein